MPENLQMEVLTVGKGISPETGQIAVVHYTGYLTNGSKFDSSVDRNEPFEVAVGVGQVIGGWDLALLRMRLGDKVRLTIPPNLAYGEGGIEGVIPPNATLIFEVELLEVK
ncbi:MAG TPA: FKBP-type peptidyl-prolyl cis-trans isomerase [Verrucomicrobiae bacterium]|nr:FKBP-type peptidyl-prolyl cis-trans isomerase [Verrucomicrobiae bacterium]